MLQNDDLVAKIGVDTAENGPRQVCGALGLASPDDDDAFRCGSSFAAAAKREMRYGGNGYPRYAHPPRAGSYTGEPVSSRKSLPLPKVLPSPRLSSRASLSHSGVLKIGAQGNARSLSPAVSPRANLGQSGAMFVLSLF